jgi:hypothetical protein
MSELKILEKEKNLPATQELKSVIPTWLIWIQCAAFLVLYAVWILPEIVGFRNTALVVGALSGLYPIYQYRACLLSKRAMPIWLIVALFIWATFHLIFLSQDYATQLLELKRIWKYAALGVIFAFGLGLSLASVQSNKYYRVLYLGLMSPILIYLGKYLLTILGVSAGATFKAYATLSPGYAWIPKYSYVAFCLPTLAIAFGYLRRLVDSKNILTVKSSLLVMGNALLICAILFIFYEQDIRNGIAGAFICFLIFLLIIFLFHQTAKKLFLKLSLLIVFCVILGISFYWQMHKNAQWSTLAEDTKIALQIDQYSHWKFAGAQGYPNRGGAGVSPSNYERVAWAKVGAQLVINHPLGYGLVEDSFKRLVKEKWPEASPNLSHSHSGWIDLALGMGLPGFFCVFAALLCCLWASRQMDQSSKTIVFWGLLANLILWCTTEVSTNVPFSALLFWLALSSGLVIANDATYNLEHRQPINQ